jgi:hypothetical protein
MNLSKYKLPMDELPFRIRESLKEEIHNSEFSGFNNAYELHREGSFSTGICKNNKGEILVTCVTEMFDVTPRMIDWWFGWHLPESERYQLWHPKAHVSSRLTQDNSHFTTDKEKYINIDSYVKEYIGKQLNVLCISFVEPKQFGFPELNPDTETAICAHVKDLSKNISIASITHLVSKSHKGSIMQSSFWLGMNLEHSNRVLNLLIKPLLNVSNIKAIFLTDKLALDLLVHCAEEMNHLPKFLPTLYMDFNKFK